MRPQQQPVITRHRLARLTTWTRLWLGWFASFCRGLGLHPALSACEAWLPMDRMRTQVGDIIMLHAHMRVVLTRRAHFQQFKCKSRGVRAAVLGSALRRRLRCAGLLDLIAMVAALDTHVARLARRLRRGLTRRRRAVFPTAETRRLVSHAPRCARLYADTS